MERSATARSTRPGLERPLRRLCILLVIDKTSTIGRSTPQLQCVSFAHRQALAHRAEETRAWS
jgi:hypothetical protein